MDSFINNPGLQHIGMTIFKHLDHKTLVSCRLVNRSWKSKVDDSNFWLKMCAQSGKDYLKTLETNIGIFIDFMPTCTKCKFTSFTNLLLKYLS